MKAGLTDADAYLEEWRRVSRPCGDDLDREVESEAAELEARYDRGALVRLTRAGGIAEA